jgi:hypothetical protein
MTPFAITQKGLQMEKKIHLSGIPAERCRRPKNALCSSSRRAGLHLLLGGFLAALDAVSMGKFMRQAQTARLLAPPQNSIGAAIDQSASMEALERADSGRGSQDNFVVRRPQVIDNMHATSSRPTAGWVLATGQAVLSFDSNVFRSNTDARGCLVLSGLGATVSIRKDFGGSGIVPGNGVLVIPIHISEVPLADATTLPVIPRPFEIFVELCSDSAFAVGTSARMARSLMFRSSGYLRSGWNDIQISTSDDGTLNATGLRGWTYSGTAAGNAASRYQHVRIVIQSLHASATETPVVKLGGIYQNGASSANVLLNCDDGHLDTVDIVQVFNSFGIQVSVGVVTGLVAKGAQMNIAQLQALYEAGNDIVSHSNTHPVSRGLQGVTDMQLHDEVTKSREWLQLNGMPRTADVFIYPQNAFGDRELDAVAAAGYRLARGASPGWTATLFGIDNPLALGSRNVGGYTLAQVKRYLDCAQTYGCTQIIYMHGIGFVQITSLTVSAGMGTVEHAAQSTPLPLGTAVRLRGFDNAACNANGVVEPGSTATSFLIRLPGAPDGIATSTQNNRRFYSPTHPAAGGPPPASTEKWYLSDYIALATEIARRRTLLALTPIRYLTLLERCTLG